MTRHLYMFAVLSPGVASDLRNRLESSNAEDQCTLATEHVWGLVQCPEPHVAYYRVILDGWDCCHKRVLSDRAKGTSATLLEQIEQCGIAWLDPALVQEASTFSDESAEGDGLGDYAIRAFLCAANDWVDFIRATDCIGLLAWKCVGPTFDDSEYKIYGASS